MKAFLVELQNKPGELARITEAIAAKGINVTGVSGTACGSSGRVALLTADEAGTKAALQSIGNEVEELDVVEANLRHEPGTLAAAARRIADAGINIEALVPMGMSGGEVAVGFVTSDAAGARQALAATTSGSR